MTTIFQFSNQRIKRMQVYWVMIFPILALSFFLIPTNDMNAQTQRSIGADGYVCGNSFDQIRNHKSKLDRDDSRMALSCSDAMGCYGFGTNSCVVNAPNGCPYRVPVMYHVVRETNGTGGVAGATIDADLAYLNSVYAPVNIEFYECCPRDFIDDSDLYDFQSYDDGPNDEAGLVSASNKANVINIYVVDDGAAVGTSTTPFFICGYAYFPGGPDVVLMNRNCMGTGQKTMAHEIGHYLGLPHPHTDPVYQTPRTVQENPANDNTNTDYCDCYNSGGIGDGIGDTPPDPILLEDCPGANCMVDGNCNLSFTSGTGPTFNASDCSGNDFAVNLGDYNNSDLDNVMSYAPYNSCNAIEFTACQNAKMLEVLVSCRSYLCCTEIDQHLVSSDTFTICEGDPLPTFEATSSCYDWYDAATGGNIVQSGSTTGSTTFNGAGTVNNNTPGTYEFWLAPTNPINPDCRTKVTLIIEPTDAEAGIADPTLEVCNVVGIATINLNDLLTGEDAVGIWTLAGSSPTSPGVGFNSGAGTFNPVGEAAGVYQFTYTVGGATCGTDFETVMVEIIAPCCDATFDYGIDPVELCVTDAIINANFTDSDGSFAAPVGLVIDATTGAINPSASIPGTYTVTHSVNTNSGCEETLTVTIDGEVEAGTPVAMMPEVCNIAGFDPINLSSLLTGADTGGTWTETTASTGLSGNSFDPFGQAAGTYTFVYTVNGGACPNDQASVSVTIVDPCCDATFDYGIDPVELCATDAIINANFTDPDGDFTASPATGLVIDAITGAIDPGASVPGIYTITHSVNTNVGCEENLTVTIDGVVNAGTAEPAIEICNVPGTELVILDDLITGADAGGVWSESSATPSVGGVSPPNIFDPIGEAAGTYTFDYFMEGGACPDDTETVTVIIYEPCCEALAGSGSVTLPLCPEDPIGLDVSGYFVDPDYNFFFVLVDADTGLIVEVIGGNSTTITSPINFTTTTPGNYITYAYSEEIGNGTTIPLTVGESIDAVLGDGECYDAAQIGGLIVMPSPFVVLGGLSNTLEGMNGGFMPVYYNNHEIFIGGGTQPYQYDWDRTGYVRWETTGSTDAAYNEQININYADNAEWTVTVTDANGCTDAILVFTNDDGTGGGNTSVSNAGNILDIDNVLIEGESLGTGGNDGVVDITMAGCDGGPYTYAWTGPNGFSASTEDINALESGFYTVLVSCGDQVTEGYYWVPLSRNGGRLKTAVDGLALTAYPNPFSEMSTISFMTQIGGPASLEVYDLTGRQIAKLFEGETQSNKVYDLHFSAEAYESGIYICKLSTTDKEIITQLVLIR